MIGLIISVLTIVVVLTICCLPDTYHEGMMKIRVITTGIGFCIVCLASWMTAIGAVKKARGNDGQSK